jgi:hypothetical protein
MQKIYKDRWWELLQGLPIISGMYTSGWSTWVEERSATSFAGGDGRILGEPVFFRGKFTGPGGRNYFGFINSPDIYYRYCWLWLLWIVTLLWITVVSSVKKSLSVYLPWLFNMCLRKITLCIKTVHYRTPFEYWRAKRVEFMDVKRASVTFTQ